MSQEQQDHYQKQLRAQYHNGNLQGQQQEAGERAQVLNILSEIDDLPMDPEDDPILGQFISKLTSTTNLSEAQVTSNEWVREYLLLLHQCQFPTPDGCHGSWRGWAHGDAEAAKEPLQPKKGLIHESITTSSKLALQRSEDAKVMEEGARQVNESIVNDDDEQTSGGGILGRLRG